MLVNKCEFRFRRVSPNMVSNIIFQLEKKTSEKSGSGTSTASLEPVHGSLHPDSYYSVDDLVKTCEIISGKNWSRKGKNDK